MARHSDETRVLVVSPHFDDAVLSAWAITDDRRRSVDVLTVFGGAPAPGLRTAADDAMGFADGYTAIMTRRDEDARALANISGTRAWLDLLELQYAESSDRHSDLAVLLAALEAWLARSSSSAQVAVIAPAGAGVPMNAGLSKPSNHGSRGRGGFGLAWLRTLKHRSYVRRKRAAQQEGATIHPDHLFVRDAVLLALRHHANVALWLYEDLPYLWSKPADREVARVAAQRRLDVEALTLPVDRTQKYAALAHYASQLPALDPALRRLESPETLPEVERYWVVSRP